MSGGQCRDCPQDTFSDGHTCIPCKRGLSSRPGSSKCTPTPSKRPYPRSRQGLLACTLSGFAKCRIMTGSAVFECVDTQNTLDSCGGCVGLKNDNENTGRDCSTIENADVVRCSKGRCVVDKCRNGYKVGMGDDSCVLSVS